MTSGCFAFGVCIALSSCWHFSLGFVQSGDQLQTIYAGNHKYCFRTVDHLYYVAAVRSGEPSESILQMLEMLHNHILSVLNRTTVDRIFGRRANYDLRNLLGGTDSTLHGLITAHSNDASYLLRSTQCLALPPNVRNGIGDLLHRVRSKDNGSVLYALMLSHSYLVSLVRPKHVAIQPSDLLLLNNFVNTSMSLKTDQSWTPICLPGFDDEATMFAYVCFLNDDCCVIYLSVEPDAFPYLAQQKNVLMEKMGQNGWLDEISNAVLNRTQ